MHRDFVVEEIMLDGVAGEIRGVVEVDVISGMAERINCATFSFRDDKSDQAVLLTERQRELAIELAERTLESESEMVQGGRLVASAARLSPSRESTRVLAEYLSAPTRRLAEPTTTKKVV